MRLINADVLAAHIAAMQECASLRDHVYLMGVLSMIDNTPDIDAVPVVHARWALFEGCWACSECGCSPADWEQKPNNPYGLPPHCHCCGAKMDGEPGV